MDIVSIIGLIAGFGFVILGYSMDGGNVKALLLLNAFIIVAGGTFGAIFVSYGINQIKAFPKLLAEIFIAPKSTINQTIEYLITLSQTAKQNGLLSLEKAVLSNDPKKQIDPFLKRGILSVVDGTDPEKISEILQSDIYVYEQNKLINIQMFDSLAAYAPAFGMVGTIVGLIQVLQAGMDSPEQLTKAIGVAFITTLYGVLLANLIFTPASTKLRARLSTYRLEKEMIIEAVCAIRNGVNPKMLKEQLSSYSILDLKKPTITKEKANPTAKNGTKK
ncbi:MAG: hypothetical protein A2Y17_04425 [Clostridiales bacterium GWF2_38_85]|nr:MAG: hypothetical protein A2Y17_04425 [Clostridiales bacterium GWF2_38_85]HBL83402.1 motility protein A [Clostridiales bacterium]